LAHIFKTSGDVTEFKKYDGKCKALNKLTGKIILWWIIILCIMAWLGAHGVVLNLK
jgi:hypothetical protein